VTTFAGTVDYGT